MIYGGHLLTILESRWYDVNLWALQKVTEENIYLESNESKIWYAALNSAAYEYVWDTFDEIHSKNMKSNQSNATHYFNWVRSNFLNSLMESRHPTHIMRQLDKQIVFKW